MFNGRARHYQQLSSDKGSKNLIKCKVNFTIIVLVLYGKRTSTHHPYVLCLWLLLCIDIFLLLLQELVVSSPNERNWRGIFIALLVIVAVLGLIVFSIVLVSPPEEGPRVRGRKPTLEDIFLKIPPPPRFNGTWISGEQEQD